MKENKISFALCLISYKDGHSQNSFVWYDDEHIYATEMNEIGSVAFHVIDNANKEIIKPTDETSSSILKMLLALENGGSNGGGGETTTKQVFKGGVDILDKPLDVESKATFGADVEVDGTLTINSATDLKTKDGTSIGGGTLYEPSIVKAEERAIYIPASLIEKYDKGETLGVLLFGTQTPCLLLKDEQTATNALSIISYDSDNKTLVYKIYPINKTDGKIDIATPITFSPLASTDFFTYLSAIEEKIGTKQSTLYRHTVTIYEGNTQDGNSICFTAYTPSNTPIDSIQDLTASADGSNKLANTDLECFGVSGTASALVFYNKIHVGTSITNTTLQKVTGGSATLASVYASYTMKDDVTLN